MSRRGRSVRRKLKASSARRGLLSLFGRHWQTDGRSLKVAHTNKAQPYPNQYVPRNGCPFPRSNVWAGPEHAYRTETQGQRKPQQQI